MKISNVLQSIENNEMLDTFKNLYGEDEVELGKQKERYINAINIFSDLYQTKDDIHIFSASGRTEIGGNHTDHQNGCVLAAAINLDIIAVVAFHDEGIIRLKSEGYEDVILDINNLSKSAPKTDTELMVKGIASKFIEKGISIKGFDAYCTSNIKSGAGVSSSAAFEVLIGTIIDTYYNDKRLGPIEIAKIGQHVENVYLGKSSGLMDQTISTIGGLAYIDFLENENPKIESFNFDFEKYGYALCITDTKSSHANLTNDYVAIRNEMESVAKQFGKEHLRFVDEEAFYNTIAKLRETCTDRAITRAAHFFEENRRARLETEALKVGDIETFLDLVRKSGQSSATLLQNYYSCSNPENQAITIGVLMSEKILSGKGAVRVHGGGFAGTIQAFVPATLVDEYVTKMNSVFGEGACTKIRIRARGAQRDVR